MITPLQLKYSAIHYIIAFPAIRAWKRKRSTPRPGRAYPAKRSALRTQGLLMLFLAALLLTTPSQAAPLSQNLMRTDAPSGPLRWTQATPTPEGVPVGAQTAVLADQIWLAEDNQVWKSSDGTNWSLLTDAPEWRWRTYFSMASFDNYLWVLGGVGSEYPMNDVWYSSDGITWLEATSAAPWSGRFWHVSLVFDGRVWVLGGHDDYGQTLNDVWYSEDGANWVEATDNAPWAGRDRFAGVVFDGKMWISGGWSQQEGLVMGDVWSSTDGANWTYESFCGRRFNHTMTVYDNKMLLLGGWYGGHLASRIWSSETGRGWTEWLPAAPWVPCAYPGAFTIENKLCILGGAYGLGEALEVWYAEPDPYYSADQNQDYVINTSELLRVIQFFNSGGYHCAEGTEDGYAPGPGETMGCPPYSCDYVGFWGPETDWEINMTELLRVVQFFNSHAYHICSDGEDGFCPAAE